MADMTHSIQIASPLERVYPLVASGNGFSQWWAADVTESRGIVDLGFFNRNTIYRLKPELIEARRQSALALPIRAGVEGTRLLFDVTASGKNTLLRFTHAGWRAETDYFVACTTTWGELMFRIKAAAEGKAPGPLFSAGGMAY